MMDYQADPLEALRLRARRGGINEADTAFYRAILDRLEAQKSEVARLREALAFARSAIKSGESWTDTCEQVIGAALDGRAQG